MKTHLTATMKTKKDIDVLIPTYKRSKALAVTLTSLYYQEEEGFEIVIANQSEEESISEDETVASVMQLLNTKGIRVSIISNLPRRGMAQQRQFLLDHCDSNYSLFLDDDVILEPYVLKNMKQIIKKYGCGFVGSVLIGFFYENDFRPDEQHIEFWEEIVKPETIVPNGSPRKRYLLHNAANVLHVQQKYDCTPDEPKAYKVAWVGGCMLYDTEKLISCGGFQFWKELPAEHCGEDVLAQLRVMKKYGGCGILPSGVYHQELEPPYLNDK